jgi:hypothetical protein
MQNRPLRIIHREFSSLDSPTLSLMFSRALSEGDSDVLEPLLQQLMFRSMSVVSRAIRNADPSLSPQDSRSIEDEALIKLLSRLGRGGKLQDIRSLAYEIARDCALDPDRRRAPQPKAAMARPNLRVIHG